MKTFSGDIWSFHPKSWVVIPTNVGWTKDGKNVMGAGLANDAAKRFPDLAEWYGVACRVAPSTGMTLVWRRDYRLILFPVKPLNPKAPHLSWRNKASLAMIERHAEALHFFVDLLPNIFDGEIAVPIVGCGNGGLDPKDVVPILEMNLSSDRFVLVGR